MELIGILCLILISTTLASHVSKRIGIPAVIGQLLIGIVLGPAMLNWVHQGISITEFSEIGVILLMFLAGLESDVSLLKKYFKPGILVAILGIAFPIVITLLFGRLFSMSLTNSIFLGLVLSATSVSISVEVLKELNMVSSKEGSTILAASVVDDILVVLILSISLGFLSGEGAAFDSEMILLLVEQVLYFAGIYFLVKWGAPYLMQLSEKLLAGSSVIIMSLVICLGMSFLADLVGLSGVIGAFFAGIAVGQTDFRSKVDLNIEAIGYAVFIPVFFVSIGLNVSFAGLTNDIWFIVALTLVAVVTKLLGGFIGSKMVGFTNISSTVVGAGMISRGEMALIIVQIGNQAGMIDPTHYTSIVIVIILSTIVSPLIMKQSIRQLKAKEA
ncbi:monovalent cation:proton antiporter-2 (CPA2) family transporter [Enterococcus phoeniculicola]|jgi:monovalent cation:proton antiporter-2 (CPA2) family protein|uniref:Monovalent cation:proton antiporter-2 (CPA2) family transporter n=1 Tax=Enterococcus phoeniculicola ATCC BAA-412 TaxID=1158610 RepID=R3W6D2_9ENTE|nr:monovalent cation:proton antiporter-2 (CPA2) family protein [Enterococcus phoeniculicola]EOL43137.1 monovalent cation:proton antiporter-2 (CPA2) family transporter [Enterococcus phoeniculicola ATCC BAA-412]EOT76505.1 monovalent cation:proton antiporter-2 family protein [Enterococcus phoeniculicola ATCC BAA-412]OJG71122.1 monovalent cation:proton antiporter-2 (CPA2) family transporter [Enterococcus phoeniculicola]